MLTFNTVLKQNSSRRPSKAVQKLHLYYSAITSGKIPGVIFFLLQNGPSNYRPLTKDSSQKLCFTMNAMNTSKDPSQKLVTITVNVSHIITSKDLPRTKNN